MAFGLSSCKSGGGSRCREVGWKWKGCCVVHCRRPLPGSVISCPSAKNHKLINGNNASVGNCIAWWQQGREKRMKEGSWIKKTSLYQRCSLTVWCCDSGPCLISSLTLAKGFTVLAPATCLCRWEQGLYVHVCWALWKEHLHMLSAMGNGAAWVSFLSFFNAGLQ